MYLPGPLFDLVDVVCLRGRWTLKITRLGLVGRVVCLGGGVPAVLGGVSVVVTYIYRKRQLSSISNTIRYYAQLTLLKINFA